MTRDRVDSLEEDKRSLAETVRYLQEQVDRLAPENAYLHEALRNAEATNLVSTILIAVGGGIISYATFADVVGKRLADFGAGILGGGVLLLLIVNVRRWRARALRAGAIESQGDD